MTTERRPGTSPERFQNTVQNINTTSSVQYCNFNKKYVYKNNVYLLQQFQKLNSQLNIKIKQSSIYGIQHSNSSFTHSFSRSLQTHDQSPSGKADTDILSKRCFLKDSPKPTRLSTVFIESRRGGGFQTRHAVKVKDLLEIKLLKCRMCNIDEPVPLLAL